MDAGLVTLHLDASKLFDLTHCNFVIDKVMSECTTEEQFVLFGKVLYGKHGWGVAAKHYIQLEQFKSRGADQDIMNLALRGQMDAAKQRFKQWHEAKTLLERIHQIKSRILELEK